MYFAPRHFQTATPILPWTLTLTPGDIVSFRFPTAEVESVPKARPCLVVDILRKHGERYAVLAYGTSSSSKYNRGLEVRLSRQEQAVAAGLNRPTRFIATRRVTVELGSPGFVAHPGLDTPVLGRVSGIAFACVQAIRAHLREETCTGRCSAQPLLDHVA